VRRRRSPLLCQAIPKLVGDGNWFSVSLLCALLVCVTVHLCSGIISTRHLSYQQQQQQLRDVVSSSVVVDQP
jgi:hypothetical protein